MTTRPAASGVVLLDTLYYFLYMEEYFGVQRGCLSQYVVWAHRTVLHTTMWLSYVLQLLWDTYFIRHWHCCLAILLLLDIEQTQ